MKIKPINQDYYKSLLDLYKAIGESKRGLEIGLGWGTSAQAYLDTFPAAKLDSIEQQDFHGVFEPLQDEYKERLHIIVGQTPFVFEKIKLGEYDFIYIDAAHDYEHVMMDIINTWAALQDGGIMAFDDYGMEGLTEEGEKHGVKEAVDYFFENEKPLFYERGVIAFRKE